MCATGFCFADYNRRLLNIIEGAGTGQKGAAQFGKRKIFFFWVND